MGNDRARDRARSLGKVPRGARAAWGKMFFMQIRNECLLCDYHTTDTTVNATRTNIITGAAKKKKNFDGHLFFIFLEGLSFYVH